MNLPSSLLGGATLIETESLKDMGEYTCGAVPLYTWDGNACVLASREEPVLTIRVYDPDSSAFTPSIQSCIGERHDGYTEELPPDTFVFSDCVLADEKAYTCEIHRNWGIVAYSDLFDFEKFASMELEIRVSEINGVCEDEKFAAGISLLVPCVVDTIQNLRRQFASSMSTISL